MAGGGCGMNLDEARRTWQSHVHEPEPKMSEDEMLALVKRNASAFDRTISRRDRHEAIAGGVVAIFFLPLLISGPWITRAGVLVVLGAIALIVTRLHAAREVEAANRLDFSLAELLESERARVDSQIRLLESVVSWYIIPPTMGAMLIVVGLAGLGWFTAGYTIFCLAVSILIYASNRRAVRDYLRPRQAELDRLIRELKG